MEKSMIFNNAIFERKPILALYHSIKSFIMKSIFFACFLIISSVAICQDKTCNLWLGDSSASTNNIKQFAEKYLELQTKLLPAETPTIQEMRDGNGLAQIKIWLKPKKMLVSG